MLRYVHRDRTDCDGRGGEDGHLDFHNVAFHPQRPYGLLGTGSPGRPPRLSQCCFTSTEAIRIIGDGEPRMTTASFTMLLYIHRGHTDYWGRGAEDGHRDFHTAPELCGSSSVLFSPFINVVLFSPDKPGVDKLDGMVDDISMS